MKLVCGKEDVTINTLKNIAKRSLGKSIADLENIVNLALRNATKNESRLTDDILLDAYEQAEFGLKKSTEQSIIKLLRFMKQVMQLLHIFLVIHLHS